MAPLVAVEPYIAPGTAFYPMNFDPFELQNAPQGSSLLESLFGIDNANFVPPFSEDPR